MRYPILLMLAVFVAACGGRVRPEGPQASAAPLREMPGWYRKPPKADDQWIFAPATATSADLQVALNRAQADGRVAIATQLEVKYSALSRRFVEETGVARDAQLLNEYEQTYKSVVSQVLIGSRAKEQQFNLEDGVYRAWVLMELPVGEASRKLLDQIKQQEQLYTRLRASEAYKELNTEVEKYEATKNGRRP